MVYDWTITSGACKKNPKYAQSKFAKSLATDGIIGSGTIGAINDIEDQKALLDSIAEVR